MINTLSEITQLWDKALLKIKDRLSEDKMFSSFFEDSYIYQINGETIIVVVNSALAVQLMKTKYYDLISEVILELTETTFKLDFIESGDNFEYLSSIVFSFFSFFFKNLDWLYLFTLNDFTKSNNVNNKITKFFIFLFNK